MTRDELNKLFHSIMIFLENLQITPILFYGSLLGYHREDNFIEGDGDIDMLVTHDQIQILRKHTYNHRISGFENEYTTNTAPYLKIFFGTEGVDFYQYEIIDDKLYIEWNGGLTYPLNDIFPLQTVYFQNHLIHIPNNPEKVVCDTYGDGWRIPLRSDEYDWNEITKVELIGKVTLEKASYIQSSTIPTLRLQRGRIRLI
jgi:hypothetical protein